MWRSPLVFYWRPSLKPVLPIPRTKPACIEIKKSCYLDMLLLKQSD